MFRLLEHWRQCEQDGLTPLIWNPSCELLNNDVLCSQSTATANRNKIPSSSDSGSSSSNNPLISDPEDDEAEEDFAAYLAKIIDSELDNDLSDPPLPSPHPWHGSPSVLNPQVTSGTPGDTPPSLQDHSSRSCRSAQQYDFVLVIGCAAQLSQEHTTPVSPHGRLSQFREQPSTQIRTELIHQLI
jgi:hypothetical protein